VKSETKVGILSGGGDAPGINAVIRAVVRKGIQHYGYEIVGIRDGWRGLLEGEFLPLDLKAASGILPRGGSILGTSRTNPFKYEKGAEKILKNAEKAGVEAVVVIGGEDTLGVAHKMSELGLKCVGVPKTIDNDLAGTDYTFGFHTAVAIATETLDRLHTTAEAHHRVIILEVMGRYCYDDKTELLTKGGWKPFKDVKPEDEVMTLNMSTRRMEWQKPTQFIKEFFESNLIVHESREVSLYVTPNHNILVEKKDGLSLVRAELKPTHIHFVRKAEWGGEDKEWFILPEYRKIWKIKNQFGVSSRHVLEKEPLKIKMNDFLRFLGYYLSEGCCRDRGSRVGKTVAICQRKKSNRAIIKEHLKKLPFKFYEDSEGFHFSSAQLYSYVKQFAGSKERFIPKEFKNLSKRQLQILLDALILGDGSEKGLKERKKYFSSSRKLLDDVQEIAIKCGYASNLVKDRHQGLAVSILKKGNVWIERKAQYREVPYKGFIYCVSVPNKVLLVRRDYKTVFCGNTGWIALEAGLAGGADAILIPEKPFDLNEVYKYIKRREKRGRNFSIIVVAEGAKPKGKAKIVYGENVDEFGHVRFGGVGYYLGKEIEKHMGIETRVVVLGHVQRGGSPTAYDRVLATRYGVAAIDLVHEGTFGCMVALKGNKIVPVLLKDVAGKRKTVDLELYEIASVFFG
jgi:6-phosphofructokinase